MSTYPSLKIDPEQLRMKMKDDEIKDLKYKTEKHDQEKILKLLQKSNEYCKNKYKSLN